MLINFKQSPDRLDRFLSSLYPEISRSQIQKNIAQGQVLVNDKIVNKHYRLTIGDKIKLKTKLTPKSLTLNPNLEIKLDIIFEDDNYLVLNKPAGLIVHPSLAHPRNDTLVNGVLAHYPALKEVGENKLRSGIIHRLDREVSGLIVFAKTQAAFLDLKAQFKKRQVYKEYLALVHGRVSQKHGFIKLGISRSQTKGYKMAARPDAGKEAVTEYTVLQQFPHYTFLRVVIHTGRTHQIRAHFSALGYPLVGDKLYRPRSLKTRVNPSQIFLHAHQLEFMALAGKKMFFQQDLPSALSDLLQDLD